MKVLIFKSVFSNKIPIIATFENKKFEFWGLSLASTVHAASKVAAYSEGLENPSLEDAAIGASSYELANIEEVSAAEFKRMKTGLVKGKVNEKIKEEFTALFRPKA
jgi:hypothetical protein